MKLISMADDRKSFQICAISCIKKFNIKEMLLIKQGETSDHAGRNYSYIEYKIRVLIDRFGTYRTYVVRYFSNKNNWYIMDNCSELLEDQEIANYYQYL